ncbi:MAG: transposase, partial [Chlorobiales bacterium]|nr:transposase [Chlorobiales bacterium]
PAKEKWLNDRRAELLPCGYYHLVFTLPHESNALVMGNPKLLLGRLFYTVAQVLQCFAKDPNWRLGGRLGFIAVLHTWSQTLMDHFHLHCLVPAGALSMNQCRWITARGRYLFKNRSLAKAFKHRYIHQLIGLYQTGELQFAGKTAPLAQADNFGKLIRALRKKDWIVYTKRPFAGPLQVLEYLGRYTHRVAIATHRILSVQDNTVTFAYRDRADGNKAKTMTLAATEFIRRFLLHVLPDGFVKIRYFGFLAHRNKTRCVDLIRKLIDPGAKPVQKRKETLAQIMLRTTGIDITRCPKCGRGTMVARPLPTDTATVA